ncbi:MAG: ROK family protein [Oscillospiraceae bacterium]|nr:ROK family protein [Oscillospiraceae bacterium]
MKHYIGVDLGGTNIAAGIVTADGTLLHKDSVPTGSARGYESVLADMAELCRKIIADSGIDPASVVGIGVGSPGFCDEENGVIVFAGNLHFQDVPIRAILGQEMGLPVYLANDANCAALGESTAGAARDSSSSVTITLGTGVGSGIVIDKKILSGAFGGAGEIGHTSLIYGGALCTCGRLGCWEAYASATALIAQAKAAVEKHPESRILALADGDANRITGKVVFDAADEGDCVAETVIAEYLCYVAAGLANTINTLQPDTIVLGGGICAQGDRILAPIREEVVKEVFGGELKTKLVIATLGNDAGIIGAAMLALEEKQ